MKIYKFISTHENVVKDATLEIILRLPLEFNKFSIQFSYYCELCLGTGEENTDYPNLAKLGCIDCNNTGRITKIMSPDKLSEILDPLNIKTLKNTLIALESSIS